MPGATLLLGATRQWLAKDVPSLAMIARDRPFTYVGSAGPMSMAEGLRTSLERLGRLLGEEIGLRGVFGVDFVEADGQAVVIEINPRYPASAELIEESLGINLFEMHRRCFVADSARPIHSATALPASNGTWAKAIVYATSSVRLARPLPVWEGESTPVGCADRPAVGTLFEPGQPICTLLARLSSPDRLDWPNEQVEQLRQDYLSEC
jgi:predicted ATP-grasp superfamily ATP-dependent carboligase